MQTEHQKLKVNPEEAVIVEEEEEKDPAKVKLEQLL